MAKCNKCSKELKKGSFFAIRENKKISQRLCPDCYKEIFLLHHHNFWTCYECYQEGDLEKKKYLTTCPKCKSKSIWFSEISEKGGEKVIECDESFNFPSPPLTTNQEGMLLIIIVVSVVFCMLGSWILIREEKKT